MREDASTSMKHSRAYIHSKLKSKEASSALTFTMPIWCKCAYYMWRHWSPSKIDTETGRLGTAGGFDPWRDGNVPFIMSYVILTSLSKAKPGMQYASRRLLTYAAVTITKVL